MRCAVCVKYVLTNEDNAEMDETFLMVRKKGFLQLNAADEAALSAAISIFSAKNITVVCMGGLVCYDLLTQLLPYGTENVVLLSDTAFAGADSLATSKTLCSAIKQLGPFDLVLCGRRALDGETGQVPAELAAHLNFNCITNVTKLQIKDTKVECHRLLEDGIHILEAQTPLVISLCEYSHLLRSPTIAEMRNARQQKVTILNRTSLALDTNACGIAGSPTRVVSMVKHCTGRRHITLANSIDQGALQLATWLKEAAK